MRRVLCSLALFANPLIAQVRSNDTVRTATIVVTATRVPLTQGTLPVAVTVINGEELRLRGVTTVADALRDVTSAYVTQAGSPGATTSLFLRGGESKYVKVLIDGVPVNDPGGTYDFASLTTDNVERIEVVRGPASVLYGADAVTGVVHVITRRGQGPTSADVDVSVGTAPRDRFPGQDDPGALVALNASARASGSVASNGLAGTYSVALGRHESNGLFALNNAFHDNVLSARASFAPDDASDVRLSLRFTDHRYDYPTTSGGTPVDSNAYFAEDRTVLGVEGERRLTNTLRAILALTSSVNDGGTNDALDAPGGSSYLSADRVRRRGGELRVHWLPASFFAVTAGTQMERQDQRSRSQGRFGAFAFADTFNASRRNTGVYVEAVATPRTTFTLTLGGRLDDNERFGTFRTGRAGMSWQPMVRTRVRATAGTAFREPTFFENYATGFVTGNPGLQPERAHTADGGIDVELPSGRARLSLTGFVQRFENMIDYTGSTAACGYSYCNVAAARANGIEGEIESRVVRSLWASLGGTLLGTKVLEPGFDTSSAGLYRSGETLIRRPEHTYNLMLSYRRAPLSVSARALFVGQRTDRDFNSFPATPVVLRKYHRLDVGAEYALPLLGWSGGSLTARVENLENGGYQTIFGYPAVRRTISMGVRAKT